MNTKRQVWNSTVHRSSLQPSLEFSVALTTAESPLRLALMARSLVNLRVFLCSSNCNLMQSSYTLVMSDLFLLKSLALISSILVINSLLLDWSSVLSVCCLSSAFWSWSSSPCVAAMQGMRQGRYDRCWLVTGCHGRYWRYVCIDTVCSYIHCSPFIGIHHSWSCIDSKLYSVKPSQWQNKQKSSHSS